MKMYHLVLAILYLSMGYDQCWQLDCTNKWRQTLDNGNIITECSFHKLIV